MQMNKYNRKFIARYKRFERWHNMAEKLSQAITLCEHFDGASPYDMKAMKEISRLIRECKVIAEDRLKETRINDRFLR